MVSSIFATDEELGKLRKKDDDHQPSPKRLWSSARPRSFTMLSPRFNKRRFILPGIAIVILWILYAFKPPDLGAPEYRRKTPKPGGWGNAGPPNMQQVPAAPGLTGNTNGPWAKQRGGGNTKAPAGPPPRPRIGQIPGAEPEHYYNGPIVFHSLPNSLRTITRTIGYSAQNRNVLFAAASLKSAATLLPLACSMGNQGRTFVHFALMGRNDLSIDQVLEINGIRTEDCDVFWHDGRPDYGAYSTDPRAEAAVIGAVTHVQAYMHPQVIITDDSLLEDTFFTRGIRRKAEEYHVTVIEMPAGQIDRLSWIARLDAPALAAWHRSSVDVLIQAEKQSTGSLMRLLASLYTADYAGIAPPRLTIELPQDFDEITRQFVSSFPWPPRGNALQSQNRLTLRARIPTSHLSPEEASIKFMESFYPTNGQENHVLVLSPNAQVSPLYFQYLKHSILEYRYSDASSISGQDLLGISLELPATHLNGTQPLSPPQTYAVPESERKSGLEKSGDTLPVNPPFLWQAPNSNAALFFGDKWVELHSFLRKRLSAFHEAVQKTNASPKLVSNSLPAWMEYALELARVRGYSMLYPSSQQNPSSDKAVGSSIDGSLEWKLVTMHDEQYSPPQEFMLDPKAKMKSDATVTDAKPPSDSVFDEPFQMPAQEPSPEEALSKTRSQGPESLIPSYRTTLQSILPNYYAPFNPSVNFGAKGPSAVPEDADPIADPPPLSALPILSWDGFSLDMAHSITFADFYADEFRSSIGGCKDLVAVKAAKDRRYAAPGQAPIREGSVDDLFCI